MFADTTIQITATGSRHLGAAIGCRTFVNQYVQKRVNKWIDEVRCLTSIARTQPHAAFCAYTHGLAGKWTYLARTVANITDLLAPLEAVIRSELLPALTGREAPNDVERDLLALPARLGGLGLIDPTQLTAEYEAYVKICAPLVALIAVQQHDLQSTPSTQKAIRSSFRRERSLRLHTAANVIHEKLPVQLQGL